MKDKVLKEMIQHSRTKFASSNTDSQTVESAMDHVLQREVQALKKNGESISEAALQDELFGFLVAVGTDPTIAPRRD